MKLLKEEEKFLNKKVYNALCDMGVKDNSAQTIAAEAARFDGRLDSLETSVVELKTDMFWVKTISIASLVTLLGVLLTTALGVFLM